ncbi:unnamed protein product [Penicillium camemberti]|uniref:Str. FM013 n=1 Tax=Penicillium camemberti (strain FM 013) TaxID=1429867 RepID=A0A0G4NW55_PENC3|nr:unnamed protein product [Penicillium camemberti]
MTITEELCYRGDSDSRTPSNATDALPKPANMQYMHCLTGPCIPLKPVPANLTTPKTPMQSGLATTPGDATARIPATSSTCALHMPTRWYRGKKATISYTGVEVSVWKTRVALCQDVARMGRASWVIIQDEISWLTRLGDWN